MSENKSYLGLDFSTQQLKAVVVNDDLEVTHQAVVNYDIDLPEFRTHGGVHVHDDEVTVTAPPMMWTKALDLLLERLKLEGVDFSTVVAVSGAAQQHGAVYWKNAGEKILRHLSPNYFLHEQVQGCFSVRESPIWMDSSTAFYCRSLEAAIGGAMALAQITGSRAYERFTASQICKFHHTRPGTYYSTERISLISSFGATLFLGRYAPIDLSDGSGMNLLDINTKDWCEDLLEICAPSLRPRLEQPVPTCTVLGSVSSYFIERYGFSENCKVVAFTGDNPASLAGTRMNKEDFTISLGTSDTVFLWTTEPNPSLSGHVFCNPLKRNEFMALLCFKNGSLTRERIRDECAEGSWDLFNDILESTPRGNFGNIGMFFDKKEILPAVVGDFRFNKNNESVARFSQEVEVRALVEGQFLAKRVHAEDFGFKIDSSARIIATGGASTNKSLIQVLADIFNLPVFVLDIANSACLGSAFRAKHALLGEDFCFQDMFQKPPGIRLSVMPAKDSDEVYGPMLARYRILQERVFKFCNPPKE